jgi:lipoprotein Spr
MQDKAIEIVAKYLGKPYKHGGRTDKGYDCWGLAVAIYKDLGYELLDMNGYDASFNWKDKSLFILNYHIQWEKVDKPCTFDGVLFENKRGLAVHVGIMLDDEKFLHAQKHKGVIISRLSDEFFKGKVQGFYHLKRARNDNH